MTVCVCLISKNYFWLCSQSFAKSCLLLPLCRRGRQQPAPYKSTPCRSTLLITEKLRKTLRRSFFLRHTRVSTNSQGGASFNCVELFSGMLIFDIRSALTKMYCNKKFNKHTGYEVIIILLQKTPTVITFMQMRLTFCPPLDSIYQYEHCLI